VDFKKWLLMQEARGSQTKLGLYPDLADIVGQYPPIYGANVSADYVYYYDQYYKGRGVPGKNGIHWFDGVRGIKYKMPPA
jgi:hypothetical protein